MVQNNTHYRTAQQATAPDWRTTAEMKSDYNTRAFVWNETPAADRDPEEYDKLIALSKKIRDRETNWWAANAD
jgi:hypothetical protein